MTVILSSRETNRSLYFEQFKDVSELSQVNELIKAGDRSSNAVYTLITVSCFLDFYVKTTIGRVSSNE